MRNSILLFLLIFSFFGFIPQEVFANEISSPGWGWSHMMPWGWMNWGWGGMIGIGLIGLIVVLALIYKINFIVSSQNQLDYKFVSCKE